MSSSLARTAESCGESGAHGWSTGPVGVGPVFRDEASMPPHDRVGFHDENGPAVTTNDARHRGEDGMVVGFEPHSSVLALQDGELVAQHEDLDIFGTIGAPRSTSRSSTRR